MRFNNFRVAYQTKVDSIYYSFWVGKFNNMFIKRGKKKKSLKQVLTAYLLIKLTTLSVPSIYMFEILEQIKPVFKLTNCFPGKRAVVYPKAAKKTQRYTLALHWIRGYILNDLKTLRRSNSGFSTLIYQNLRVLHDNKKNPLVKKRDRYHLDAVDLQDNLRYTWVR